MYIHYMAPLIKILIAICFVQSDAPPPKSMWRFGEGDAGQGGGEGALSRRKAAPFATVWIITGGATSKVHKHQEKSFVFCRECTKKCYIKTVYFPPPQNLCKQLHSKIDITDEERYDCESKVSKHNKDVSSLQHPAQILLIIVHCSVNILKWKKK